MFAAGNHLTLLQLILMVRMLRNSLLDFAENIGPENVCAETMVSAAVAAC
ncbi:hypothetical protein TanjilG_30426 [Lupinus angustifolius]|nr:hypothetical protein TanjilG_30426 [Lupinus angustifolius]